jgi:hypothetical protein
MFSLATLPDPAEPTFIAIGSIMGALIGGTIDRFVCYDSDNNMRWTVEGTYYGTATAACLYVAANIWGVAIG